MVSFVKNTQSYGFLYYQVLNSGFRTAMNINFVIILPHNFEIYKITLEMQFYTLIILAKGWRRLPMVDGTNSVPTGIPSFGCGEGGDFIQCK